MGGVLRFLALCGLRWPLAVVVLLLSLTPAAVSFVVYGYNLTGMKLLTTGCQGVSDVSQELNNIFTIVSRVCFIAADIVVALVTVTTTWKRGTSALGQSKSHSLADVLLYDGLIYFVTLTVLNVLDLVLNQVSVTTPYHSASYITVLSDPLTAVLVYRFLLDLQAANLASIELHSSALPPLSTGLGSVGDSLRFASNAGVVAPFGASLLPSEQSDTVSWDGDLDWEGTACGDGALASRAGGGVRDGESVERAGNGVGGGAGAAVEMRQLGDGGAAEPGPSARQTA